MNQGMGHRKMKNAAEYDVHTKWRHLLCWTQKPNSTAKIKRNSRRRERHEAKAELRNDGT